MTTTRRDRSLVRLLIAFLLSLGLAVAGAGAAAPATAATTAAFNEPSDVTVMPGANATFSVGIGTYYYMRWYRVGSTTPVATDSSTLTLENVTEADDGAQFYATFYDASFNSLQTRTVTLTVGAVKVGFAADPQDAAVLESRQVTFTGTPTGTSPFTYQWQTSADEGASWENVEGATGSSLTLRPSLEQDGALVRVVVDNPVDDPTASKAARLTVHAQDTPSVSVSDASLVWGLNSIYQGGNPAGNGCNYFSAGTQLTFSGAQDGVQIVHETAEGLVAVSDGTKCIDQSTTGMQQRVLLAHGEGDANLETGEATIQWHGAFLANAYGGLVPWWLKDLKLVVKRDGTGTLSGIAGGYGSDMDDPYVMVPLKEREVTVATFQDVSVTSDGIVVQPDYEGVEITVPADVAAEAQQRTSAGWGGWPQSFVDFHFATGLSSYWYTSGLSADPDKPPFSFTVSFQQAPKVINVPAVTASPALSDGPTVVNGRTATVTATVENATSMIWQRSTSANGPWTDVDGATSESLAFTATPDWNNTYVRILATNSEGTAASAPALIKTQNYAAPSFSTQPKAVTAFAGQRASITAQATGFPAVDEASYRVQVSTDDGATWATVEDAFLTTVAKTFAIPSVDASLDGALVRLTASTSEGEEAGSPGVTVVSDAVRLTVLPSTGGPQLAVVAGSPIDPAQKTTLTVIGAGFDLPARPSDTESYSLDLALFEAGGWKPGTGGLDRVAGTTSSPNTWIGGGALYEGYLEPRGGTFTVAVTIPANTLDPSKVYGIGAYSRLTNSSSWVDTWEDRTNDAWVPVLVAGQSAAAITTQPNNVEMPAGGGTARFEVGVEGSPAPTVTWERRASGATTWTAVEGASGTVLEVPVTSADRGAAFRAVVTNGLAVAVTSHEASVAVARHALTTAVPTIVGDAAVGQQLAASTVGWTAGTSFAYQWLRDGVAVPGATGSTYVPGLGDVGARLSVTVTGSLDDYEPASRTSAPTSEVGEKELTATVPTISGSAQVGRTLTAAVEGWTSGTAFRYQWLRDGVAVPGATGATYVVSVADSGTVLAVRVTGTLEGYASASRTSQPTPAVSAGVLSAVAPRVSGTARVGKKLTVTLTTRPDGATIAYQWHRDGKTIAGATRARYRLRKSDLRKKIAVTVTATKPGYVTVSATSTAKTVAKGKLIVRAMRLRGTAKVGGVLRAKVRGWKPAPVKVTYRWYRGGKRIRGATKATYRVVRKDAGKKITARVKASKAGYKKMTKVVGKKSVAR